MPLDLQGIPPWLDEETSALVRDTVELLAQRHPDVLAIILYGGQLPGMKSGRWTSLIRAMSICSSL
ncbi:MAG TPA: hypothetical protein VFA09_02745 [Ktedonobacteraceae bacterium]|nr:hypothetical protein [Ktedonobacteraceae bacterium]